jgi:copper resistance protein D
MTTGMTDAALVAFRAVHFAAGAWLLGELIFALLIADDGWGRVATRSRSGADARFRLSRRILWIVVAGAVSGAGWLLVEAAAMAGVPLRSALDGGTLATVLTQTEFGRVWLVRAALLAVLTVAIVAHRRGDRRWAIAALASAAAYVAALAFTGHAAAAESATRPFRIGIDAVHLLATGAWLGALPALARCLRSMRPMDDAARVARQFSRVAVIAVAVLAASGLGNAWYLVATVPGLIGTSYGQLLIAKLCAFIAMLGLAAVNRWRLTPLLAAGDGEARRRLHRNALSEVALGLVVLGIVAILGTAVPAAHQSPVWPFAYTLDLHADRLVVPAYPTTYRTAPVGGAEAVARGAAIYQRWCSACHGVTGHGDGPLGPSLATKPADLIEHLQRHREGDVYWWIAHGKPGTPMPAFSPPLSDTEIWEAILFLQAQSGATPPHAIHHMH